MNRPRRVSPAIDLTSQEGFKDLLDARAIHSPLVDFNVTVTSAKRYTASVLLAFLALVEPEQTIYYDECGHRSKGLRARFTDRRFFTRVNGAVEWEMLGFEDSRPILIFQKYGLRYGLYFERRIFVDTHTGVKDYLPSAAIIVRNSSLSRPDWTRVPFSWGVDIVLRDFDARFLFILETVLGAVPKARRDHFQGFKYLATNHKYLISPTRLAGSENMFVTQNGFMAAGAVTTTDDLARFLKGPLRRYFRYQRRLYERSG